MTTDARPSEFDLIARIFAPLAGEGSYGLVDDAASFSPPPGLDLVLTKDAIAAGVHFFPDDPWDMVARKALRVNLSDLAAKGARAVGYLLALGLPDDWRLEDVDAFGEGLADDQARYGIKLIGGDTIRTPDRLVVSVTAIGTVPDGGMVRRGGALAGDRIIVTGAIGDAAIGLRLRTDPALADRLSLSEGDRNALLRRYLLPEPRMAAAGVLLDHASAAMDISDGLVGDLEKMAAASGVGIEIDAGHVPLSAAVRRAVTTDATMLELALTGGDDYEIAASVPAAAVAPVLRRLQENGIPAAVIGGVTAGEGVVVTAPEGGRMVFGKGSFAHF